MRIHPLFKICILVAVVSFLLHAPAGRAEDVLLTFTAPLATVTAGDTAGVWLNVLNVSTREVAWQFPAFIKCQIGAGQGAFDGALETRSLETNQVRLAPGTFVRCEYFFTVPGPVKGRVVLEFPGLHAGAAVLDVQAPVVAAVPKRRTTLVDFIRQGDVLTPDVTYDPQHFFKEHVSGYEPLYFIAGGKFPDAKFQISFAYQLLNNEGPLATRAPALKGFHISYTQVSLWDLQSLSAPFYDTTYQPEFFYSWEHLLGGRVTNWFQFGVQGGLMHQSNGKSGADSRSFNDAYFRPTFTFGHDDGFQLMLQPRVWTYLGDLSDNANIASYRGYADLRAVVGWKRGLELSALGRLGKNGDHGSLQLDLTYPTMRFFGSFTLYLDVQYFTGYGESLLGYDKKSEQLRVGFALFR